MANALLKNFNFSKLVKAVTDDAGSKPPHQALCTPDVLLIIFSFCLPSDITNSKGLSPLCFSQVCRTWREVTFSRKFLWSHIVINPRENANEDAEFHRLLKRCEYWVRRSCGAPLSLECNFDWHCYGSRRLYAPENVHDILEQLFGYGSRSNDRIARPPSSQSLWAFAVPSRLVELKLGPMFYVGTGDMIDLDLSMASNLRRLEIARAINLESSHWNFPNLRILSLETRGKTTLSTIVTLLESSENLEQVKIAANIDTFNEDLPDDADSTHERLTRLRHLRSLEITAVGTWSGVIAYLFDRLEVPALRALTLSYNVDHPSVWRSLTELIKDSRTDLKVLHLACRNPYYTTIPRGTNVLRVLEQASAVEFLYLHGICFTSLLTRAMNCNLTSRPEGVICPKLQTLCLGHRTLDRTDFVGLAHVLSFRWQSPHSVSTLSRIFLNFEDHRLPSAVEYLKKMRGTALAVSVANEAVMDHEKRQKIQFELL